MKIINDEYYMINVDILLWLSINLFKGFELNQIFMLFLFMLLCHLIIIWWITNNENQGGGSEDKSQEVPRQETAHDVPQQDS